MDYGQIILCCVLVTILLGPVLSQTAVDSLFGVPHASNLGIIGGLTTNITKHPYQIAINSGESFVCSGALLNRIWAVALASCAAGADPSDLTVRVGSSSNIIGGTVFNVSQIVVHPNYNYSVMDYDFALLKLSSYICFDPNTESIQFASRRPPESAQATVSGWGSTKHLSAENSNQQGKFQQLTMKVVSNSVCRNKYSKTHDLITGRMFCATAKHKGPCHNDFGDPLVINGTLFGLYSWSRGCAEPEFPAVFSNLASVNDWIYTTMNNACTCGLY